MSEWMENPVPTTAYFLLIVLAAAVFLALVRLVRGPSLPDRVVALDVIATLIVGIIGVYSVAESEPMLLRVAMVLALINFVGTVAFSYYLQRKAPQWSRGSRSE